MRPLCLWCVDAQHVALPSVVKNHKSADYPQRCTTVDIDGDMVADINAAVVLKQMNKAINKGDTNAAAFLMRLRGEDVQRHEFVDEDEKRRLVRQEMERLYGLEPETPSGDAQQD